MRVRLLGTAGYHPTESRQTACVLLPDLGIMLDAGTGMHRVGRHLTTSSLDIFLSHAHLDHVIGLSYFFSLQQTCEVTRMSVHGEGEKLAAIREHLFAPSLFSASSPYKWRPLEQAAVQINDVRVTYFPLQHPGGSVGYRIERAGRSLAYVTDTTASPGADYVPCIHGVDLLLHECNFPDGQEGLAARTGHSSLSSVVDVAIAAQAKKLVLLHFDPIMQIDEKQLDEARNRFPNLVVGNDEDEFVV